MIRNDASMMRSSGMWVEKSADENEKSLRKEALFSACVFSGIFFVVLMVASKTGWRKLTTTLTPIPWNDLASRMPIIVGASVVAFIGIYYCQKARYRRIRSRAFVCLGCGKECSDSGTPSCKCGGQCVDLNHAKWVNADDDVDTTKLG